MKKNLRDLGIHFELYLGGIFLFITTVIVIMNVFTRYFLHFTFIWAEEVAVGCFVWVIFLGLANAYKTKGLIGVEVLTNFVPDKYQPYVVLITSTIVSIISTTMFVFSIKYVANSTKITSALEISYKYIYSGMVVSFGLTTIYSIYFLIQSLRRIITGKDISIEIKDDLEEKIMDEEIEIMKEHHSAHSKYKNKIEVINEQQEVK
jgi:TRAP-type C4-dicarboxylate transport system permease small subunit